LEDLKTGAAIDLYASDQIIPFAALAGGQSQLRIRAISQHVESSSWLSREFLGATIKIEGHELKIKGVGFEARRG
jgi:RNA 3'-terminal phosphate cyclase (ATP)